MMKINKYVQLTAVATDKYSKPIVSAFAVVGSNFANDTEPQYHVVNQELLDENYDDVVNQLWDFQIEYDEMVNNRIEDDHEEIDPYVEMEENLGMIGARLRRTAIIPQNKTKDNRK